MNFRPLYFKKVIDLEITKAEKYIHSLSKFGKKSGLYNITRLLEMVGNPQDKLKFVHIAGTNGKGSCANMVSNVLTETSLKVGLFTSPFIEKFNERIQINNECISDDDLEKYTAIVKDAIEKIDDKDYHPIEFEVITAIGFLYFLDKKCDIVVLETGLGGRLDCTNIIKNPYVCAIASISFDHMQYLGDTIEKIAFEKCGIIKENCVVCLYPDIHPDAKNVALKTIIQKNASLYPSYKETLKIKKTGKENIFDYKDYKDIKINLLGVHQIYNAALAIDILENLKKYFSISDENIKNGLEKAKWPCRFEIFERKGTTFLIDGAHNSDGILKYCDAVKNVFADKKIITVFGMLNEKDFEKSVERIANISDELIITDVPSIRQTSSDDVFECAKKYEEDTIFIKDNIEAINKAIELKDENSIVAIVGSLYLAGNLRGFVDKF